MRVAREPGNALQEEELRKIKRITDFLKQRGYTCEVQRDTVVGTLPAGLKVGIRVLPEPDKFCEYAVGINILGLDDSQLNPQDESQLDSFEAFVTSVERWENICNDWRRDRDAILSLLSDEIDKNKWVVDPRALLPFSIRLDTNVSDEELEIHPYWQKRGSFQVDVIQLNKGRIKSATAENVWDIVRAVDAAFIETI